MQIAGYDVRPKLSQIPSTIPILSIHGTLDRSVYFSERKYIVAGLPKMVIAKLPRDDIGHTWYDYFGTEFWVTLIGRFLDDLPAVSVSKARL